MRTQITQYMIQAGEATARQMAAALDVEVKDVIDELNTMRHDGEVEREKKKGNEYTYWLAQATTAMPPAAAVPAAPSSAEDTETQPGEDVDAIVDRFLQTTPAGGGANNTGSHGPEEPPKVASAVTGAVAYPMHQEHAAEQQAALEKIHEQRIEIERLANLVANLRAECDNLERGQKRPGDFPLGEIVTHLQALLPTEVELRIVADGVVVYDDAHDEEYSSDPGGLLALLDALSLIRRRKVA